MKKIVTFLVSIFLVTSVFTAQAQQKTSSEFPSKKHKIKLIVHTSSGGPTDLMTREMGRAIEEVTGTNVIIENRPGGSGATAMNLVSKAKPDGYTLGAMTPSQIGLINGNLKNMYSLDSFTWMSRSQIDPYVLVVHNDSQFETIEEVIDYLKDNPNALNAGGYGAQGSAHNISWNIFASAAEVSSKWSPYESTGDAVTALLGKHIDIANSNPGQVTQYVKSGDLRILAVNAEQRLDSFPNVPTLTELGYDVDTDWVQFRGFFGPKDMPKEVTAKWDEIFAKAFQTQTYQEYMKKALMEEGYLLHDDFADYINRQEELTASWYKKLGLN